MKATCQIQSMTAEKPKGLMVSLQEIDPNLDDLYANDPDEPWTNL